jgi:hypothetical protein
VDLSRAHRVRAHKAETWWKRRSTEPPPATIDEALALVDELLVPTDRNAARWPMAPRRRLQAAGARGAAGVPACVLELQLLEREEKVLPQVGARFEYGESGAT